MAVKQNNSDSNGVSTPANDSNANGVNASAVGTASLNDSNNGVEGACSVVNKSQKDAVNESNDMGLKTNVKASAKNVYNKSNNDAMAQILKFIEFIEDKRKQISQNDWICIYKHILQNLATVHVQRQSMEDLNRFKKDIQKIGKFFAHAHEHYLIYLRIVCQIVMQTDADMVTPSCAIAIIFELFNADMVNEAVHSLLDLNYPNENIKQTVYVLCDWMRVCTFCPSLNLWVYGILNGLQQRKKYDLFDEICLQNIDALFKLLMVPIFRPRVAPVVFQMLSNTEVPQVFHKILPNFRMVATSLHQQANSLEKHAADTKQTLKQLIYFTKRLLVRFRGYDTLYEPIIESMKDIYSNYDYIHSQENFDDCAQEFIDVGQQSKNIKVGLVNLGNTCYMNSVLQALTMTKECVFEI